MSVVVSEQDAGPWRKQLTIEIPAPAVEAETARVVADFGKQARIPGFRKGKVPASLVQRRFAADIRKEVLDRLLPRYWKQAQAEKQLDAMGSPEVESVGEPIAGAPLTFTAAVEVRPTFSSLSLDDFELPTLDTGVSGDEIEQAIEGLRRDRSSWSQVDRPAAQGDLVHAEVTEIDADGNPLGDHQHGHFEIGDPRVWEEVSVALTGTAAGNRGEFTHQPPPGEAAEPAPLRRFRFVVERVDERVMPALDDELAKTVGLDTVADLRSEVAARITASKRNELSRRRQQAVLDQLRARHPIELPQGVVRHEVEHLLREYAEDLTRQGINLEETPMDWQKLGEDVRPQAERRVHARLVLDAAADAKGVTVAEEELERALAAIGRSQGRTSTQVRQTLDHAGRLEGLRVQLRRDKTLAALTGEAFSLSAPAATDSPDAP
jgi:trigger factor